MPITDILFGEPIDIKYNPAYLNYTSVGSRVLYSEDIYRGYRFYEKTGREVLFLFSHGLLYTTFKVLPSVTVALEIFNIDRPTVATI
ncbi:hypothetical protein N7467_001858 [Penicillium canescens]|nr:hypothetical protein N7467_001858 [Penicillium canescens]